ncbi:MAG: DNA alkylation repair protein [Myxococcales bacterium]|nr:DNA alkylation repair protein [Myxococcales bacterium]
MSTALKDAYNEDFGQQLAQAFHKQDKSFPKASFLRSIFDERWEKRELKDRVIHIANSIHDALSIDYPQAIEKILPVASGFRGLVHFVFPIYVELYGLQHWEISMDAMQEMTSNSSAEGAIRPFLKEAPQKTLAKMLEWTQHPNDHVRRLASEGCRPRLPWHMALPDFKRDPSPLLPILEALKDDPSEYVRKSVANNLNDIAKDHPEVVLDLATSWFQDASPTRRWIIKHGCRTLLKQAHPRALELFDFPPPQDIEVSPPTLSPQTIAIGDELHFSFSLSTPSEKLGKIRVEYAIYYRKARGQLSRKIFQLSEKHCETHQITYKRKHSFQERTTRKHYPGEHRLAIVINGKEMPYQSFQLTA